MRKPAIAWLTLASAVLGGVVACGGGAPTAARTPPPAVTSPARSGQSAQSRQSASPSATQRTSSASDGVTSAPPSRGSSSPPSGTQPSPAQPTVAPATPGPVTGRLAGKDWTVIPTSRKVIALTFDAGANADGVPSILATLNREHVAATFFLTGAFTRSYPASARQIAAAGYRIGNHTDTHPHLTQLSDSAVRDQILHAAQQIKSVTGANPAPLFRFPFGDSSAHLIAVANGLGYVPVRWTVDTLGWEGTSGHITPATVTSRVLGALQPGEIVLMHVGSNPDDHSTLDADALPGLISQLRARGYSFVTLDALTG